MKYMEKTIAILSKIYQLRILSYNQIYFYIFKKDGKTQRYCDVVLQNMVSQGLLKKSGRYNDNAYYSITNAGIKYLRNGVIPIGKSSTKDKIPEYPLLQPCKLSVSENISAHQLSLNDFVLEFEDTFKDIVDFSYFDEKYVSKLFTNIRPDGIIKVKNTHFFLEMDMNTERKNSLRNKFEHYRNFLNSKEYFYMDGKICVLFILGGNVNAYKRKTEIRSYICENIEDFVSTKFNIFVNTPDELMSFANKEVKNIPSIPLKSLQEKGFMLRNGNFSDGTFSDFSYDAYIYMLSDAGKVLRSNGENMEFIVDDFTSGSMYVYKKIRNFPRVCASFKMKKGRNIKYMIIVNSEKDASDILKHIEYFYDYMYFTTPDRLSSSHDVFSALFTIDNFGNVLDFFNRAS